MTPIFSCSPPMRQALRGLEPARNSSTSSWTPAMGRWMRGSAAIGNGNVGLSTVGGKGTEVGIRASVPRVLLMIPTDDRTEERNPSGVTVIAAGTTVSGPIEAVGDVRVAGRVDGKLRSSGTVTVLAGGAVTAEL